MESLAMELRDRGLEGIKTTTVRDKSWFPPVTHLISALSIFCSHTYDFGKQHETDVYMVSIYEYQIVFSKNGRLDSQRKSACFCSLLHHADSICEKVSACLLIFHSSWPLYDFCSPTNHVEVFHTRMQLS